MVDITNLQHITALHYFERMLAWWHKCFAKSIAVQPYTYNSMAVDMSKLFLKYCNDYMTCNKYPHLLFYPSTTVTLANLTTATEVTVNLRVSDR